MAGFGKLPFNILFEIASSTQSLADLHSLVLASRPCYNAFSRYRDSIIRSVLMNELGPANYRELLAIVHIPPGVFTMGPNREVRRASPRDPKPETDEETDDASLITVLQPYLEHYFSTRPFEDPCDADSTSQILRVYKIVRRLTDHYSTLTTRLLLELWASSTGNILHYTSGAALVAPLSRTERVRLQRAFLRYELYSRLFPSEDGRWRVRSSISGKSQFDLFIRHLERWEVEKLCSIHRFPFNLTTEYMEDMEDQLVEAYLSCPGAVLGEPTGRYCRIRDRWFPNADALEGGPSPASHPPPGTVPRLLGAANAGTTGKENTAEMRQGEVMVPFYAPELIGLELHETWRSYLDVDSINHFTSLGLEFFTTLIDASTPGERRDRIRRLGTRQLSFGDRHFLPEALTHSPDVREEDSKENWEEDGHMGENIGCDNEERDATRPNTGYREFLRSLRHFRRMRHELISSRYRKIFGPRSWTLDNNLSVAPLSWSPLDNNLSDDPFWEQGCVFWDRPRLVKFRMDLKVKPEHFVGRKKIGRYGGGGGTNTWLYRMSVFDRLKGIVIPQSQWRKLLDDFRMAGARGN